MKTCTQLTKSYGNKTRIARLGVSLRHNEKKVKLPKESLIIGKRKQPKCRRLILSGLLCLFSFLGLEPIGDEFELGPRTLSFSFISLSNLLSRFVIVKCCVVLFRIVTSFFAFIHIKCYFICLIMFLFNRICLINCISCVS